MCMSIVCGASARNEACVSVAASTNKACARGVATTLDDAGMSEATSAHDKAHVSGATNARGLQRCLREWGWPATQVAR